MKGFWKCFLSVITFIKTFFHISVVGSSLLFKISTFSWKSWAGIALSGLKKYRWMAMPRDWGWIISHPVGCQSLFVCPGYQCWGQSYLISLFIIWKMALSEPLVSLSITPYWVVVLIRWRTGRFCRGIWTALIHGSRPVVWGSAKSSVRSCPWVTTTPCKATGRRRVATKLPSGNTLEGSGQQHLKVRQEFFLKKPRGPRDPVASWPVSAIVWPAEPGQGFSWWGRTSSSVSSSGTFL